jgi:hypothetical protein
MKTDRSHPALSKGLTLPKTESPGIRAFLACAPCSKAQRHFDMNGRFRLNRPLSGRSQGRGAIRHVKRGKYTPVTPGFSQTTVNNVLLLI